MGSMDVGGVTYRASVIPPSRNVMVAPPGDTQSQGDTSESLSGVKPAGRVADATQSTTTLPNAYADGVSLSPEALAKLQKLKSRDREVRAHEAAHQSAAGGMAGPAQFTYERGPDGQQYAVGGEVKISGGATSGDPKSRLERAKTVQRAALAPAQPSGQDLAVAASAQATAMRAQQELAATGQDAGVAPGQAEHRTDTVTEGDPSKATRKSETPPGLPSGVTASDRSQGQESHAPVASGAERAYARVLSSIRPDGHRLQVFG